MDSGTRVDMITDILPGRPDDLEALRSAVRRARQRVTDLPESDPDYAYALFALSNALHLQFTNERRRTYLDEAVTVARHAVRAAAQDDPARPDYLAVCGAQLSLIVEMDGATDRLTEAIGLVQEAVALTPPEHPHYPGRLTLLAGLLALHAGESPEGDFDRALELHVRALDAAHPDDPGRSRYLRGYARTLAMKAERTADPELVTRAEQVGYAAFRAGHPYDHTQSTMVSFIRQIQALSQRLR